MKKFFPIHEDSTPETPFAVHFSQHCWGITLASFASEAEAIAFAESEWRTNHDDPDFTSGCDLRAEWSVYQETRDAEGYIIDSARLWAKSADERF